MDASTLDLLRLVAEGGIALILTIAVMKLWKAYRDEAEAHKNTLRDLLKTQSGNLNARVMMVEDRMVALEGMAQGKTLPQTFKGWPVNRTLEGIETDDQT